MTKKEIHDDLLQQLSEIYVSKNADYGDSVSDTYKKYGMISFLVRMEDKLSRLRTLQDKERQVKDEKIEDTLLDLANYALLAIIELKSEELNNE